MNKPLTGLAIAIGIALTLWAAIVSYSDVLKYGGLDISGRIIGARVLLAGENPYTYQWSAEKDVKFADPLARYPGPTRSTYPPPLLALYGIFSDAPYNVLRPAWWLAEWLVLIATGLTGVFWLRKSPMAAGLFALAMVSVAVSHFWRLHVERGQYYVFLALLLMIDAALLLGQARSRLSGVFTGIAAAMRPTLLIAVPMLWFMGKRRAAITSLLTTSLIVLGLALATDGRHWKDYFVNASAWELSFLDRPAFEEKYGPITDKAPIEFEGVRVKEGLPSYTTNLTFVGLATLGILPASVASLLGKIYIVILFVMALLFIRLVQRNRAPPEIPILILLTTLAAIDFGIPVRFSYNDIIFVPVILIMCRLVRTDGKLLIFIGVLSFSVLSLPFLSLTVVSVIRPLLMVMIVSVLIFQFTLRTNSAAKTKTR